MNIETEQKIEQMTNLYEQIMDNIHVEASVTVRLYISKDDSMIISSSTTKNAIKRGKSQFKNTALKNCKVNVSMLANGDYSVSVGHGCKENGMYMQVRRTVKRDNPEFNSEDDINNHIIDFINQQLSIEI